MRQLSATDNVMLLQETPKAPNVLGPVLICNPHTAPAGRISFEQVLTGVAERLHLAPMFRRRLVQVPLGLAKPYWTEDPDFDLEVHVRHLALPAPGDWRQLCILIARLYGRPLDMARPPWELYVIDGLDNVPGIPHGAFALYLKIHHCAVDGGEGVQILTALTGVDPAAEIAPPRVEWLPGRLPSQWELLARGLLDMPQRQLARLELIGTAVPAIAKTAVRAVLGGDIGPSIPWTRFNGQVTAHRCYESILFDLNEVKRVRAAVPGATVNDVALAMVGGALHRYLREHGELPREPLSAAVPISTRTDSSAPGGNMIEGTIIEIGTDIEDDHARLVAVSEATTNIRARSGVGVRELVRMSDALPGALLGPGMRSALNIAAAVGVAPIANTVVTNVPGPRVPLYFLGCEISAMHGTGPILDGLGLLHIVGSYQNDLILSFVSCRTMMPDPAFYAACIRESFEALTKAA
ncbi:WS/DGAT/MGAT family O-acyltransferase [Nocardia sp. NBC_01388]|uniref:WS/DGAT/MGAT family O-acyltransferase n=1 Tax=Nocardia sp. NBC_01388 TaxID=2903596 RepID=UPI00324704C6